MTLNSSQGTGNGTREAAGQHGLKTEHVVVLQGDATSLPLPDESVDAVVCDPPYGLEFMGQEWDTFRTSRMSPEYITGKPSAARIRERIDGRTNPIEGKSVTRTPEAYVAGSLFQAWCEAWAGECLRVLKPGGHLLAFGGTRTYHRLACGIEDAGFEIRDSLHWIYGSGFPKSLDVARAIDQAGGASPAEQAEVLRAARDRAGMTREDVAAAVGCTPASVRDWEEGRARVAGRPVEFIVPSPQYREKLAELLGYSEDERRVVGVAADRRGDGTVIGLGHTGVEYGVAATPAARTWSGFGTALKPAHEPIILARKPLAGTVAGNVLAHGTGALNIDGCRVAASPGDYAHPGNDNRRSTTTAYGRFEREGRQAPPHDAGRWPSNVLLTHSEGCSDYACADDCPVADLDRQSGVSVSTGGSRGAGGRHGAYSPIGAQPDVKPGFGDVGGASRFFPVFHYEPKAGSAERPILPDGTQWPTVKPVPLMQWLVRLVTPPGGKVLDLFCGTGTTGEACTVEGFDCILLDKDPKALALTRMRLAKPVQPSLFTLEAS